MSNIYIPQVAQELNLRQDQVKAVVTLLADGGTVPFIARYRKEATGTLDEVAITFIRDRMIQLAEMDKRRKTILDTIEKQEKLTPDLKAKIDKARTIAELEDLYLPYKPKRRTRGMIAKEKGLEPLAFTIFDQPYEFDLDTEAKKYINAEQELETLEKVLAGARDIIAEWVNENAEVRAKIRNLYLQKGHFHSKIIKNKEEEGAKFKDYFDWNEAIQSAPSHRVLAARRGEKEQFLLLRIIVSEEVAHRILKEHFVKPQSSPVTEQVMLATHESFKRLMAPSIENEIRLMTKEHADEEAIKTFQTNLRQLLMAAPLGPKKVMAIDPGQRTGCKIAILDAQGKYLETDTIYLTQSMAKEIEAGDVIRRLYKKHGIEVIAIGNGTASRETESFVKDLNLLGIHIAVVNESGASYYSASDVARLEFPDLDVTVRGAISIGRRLQDPLAELVKLDPKNIGVGQYQHDVDQGKLKRSLDDVIISSVNSVGVDVNTASRELLMYVAGVGPALAQSIVKYRNENGAFKERHDVLGVPRFSTKVFEQAAGFLRVIDGVNPLDASAVHPESYDIVSQFAKNSGATLKELMENEGKRKRINLNDYVTERVGLPTLKDIMAELGKLGRDPRDQFEFIEFKDDIHEVEDLEVDMMLPGVVTNVTDFGAFVDIGVHQDGLIHISEMSDTYVKHPSHVLKLQQKVNVRVKEIDLKRRRIALSLKSK